MPIKRKGIPESQYEKKFKKYWGEIPWEEEEDEDDEEDCEYPAPVNTHSEYEKYTLYKYPVQN